MYDFLYDNSSICPTVARRLDLAEESTLTLDDSIMKESTNNKYRNNEPQEAKRGMVFMKGSVVRKTII